MKTLPLVVGAVLALSACATAPIPTVTQGENFSTTRETIVRGVNGGGNAVQPPLLVQRIYPITCATDGMRSATMRAADTIKEINRLLGPVTTRTGESYFKAEEMRIVNSVTVPRYQCSIGTFSETPVSKDPAVISAFAAKNGVALTGMTPGI